LTILLRICDIPYMESNKVHPIGVVERQSGLSAHVIRKWEERYAVVEPLRTPNGRRLYSDADIHRISLLHRASETGRSIGQLVNLDNAMLETYIATDNASVRNSRSLPEKKTVGLPAAEQAFISDTVESFIRAAQEFNDLKFEQLLEAAHSKLGQQVMLDVVVPLIMHRLGDAWQDGHLRIGQEHMATFHVQLFLSKIYHSIELPESALIAVAASFKDQHHTIGTFCTAIIGRSMGWRTVYLGGNAPVAEISGAVQALKAKVLLLSLNYPYQEHSIHNEMVMLLRTLPTDVNIIMGGGPAAEYQKKHPDMRTTVTSNFSELREKLRARHLKE
jgi:MerR family transcriptional regulator, light-induced transcriptional regulator